MQQRVLPAPQPFEKQFWTGGEHDELRIGWCDQCRRLCHPSFEFCSGCTQTVTDYRAVSGQATLLAVTENHKEWLPGFEPPYIIGIVGLKEQPDIRLTTNILNASIDQLKIGDRLGVQFIPQDDIWLPVFAPDLTATWPASRDIADLPPRGSGPAVRHSGRRPEDHAIISGSGASSIARRLGRTSLSLAVEASLAAVADAGLELADIDGVCAYPGSEGLPGISSGGFRALEQALRIRPTWHCGAQEVPGQAGTVIDAMSAVASGLCRHVLCFTTFSEAKRPGARQVDGRIDGELSWRVPFGAASPANWIALYASRYMARFGANRDVLGWISRNARLAGFQNPGAIYRQPITLEDYYAAPLISTPFGLLDCDIPCDGAFAFVVSFAEAAGDLRVPPVYVEAVGTRITEVQSWDQATLTHQPNVFGPAAHLWSRTDLRPSDIDVALLYDGFTFNVISWIEALGFCGLGEATDFLDEGRRIAADGDLPLNPHGGHLSAGRTNGYGHLFEAIQQLRGTAGARQINRCRTALVSSGGGIPASCMLLTN